MGTVDTGPLLLGPSRDNWKESRTPSGSTRRGWCLGPVTEKRGHDTGSLEGAFRGAGTSTLDLEGRTTVPAGVEGVGRGRKESEEEVHPPPTSPYSSSDDR